MPISTEESNLIRLIKSLKQGEKRYVTQQLSKHKKENNLLKLYQLISKTDAIKDADIRKKIKDKKFSSQLSINKHKLYIAILDTLQEFHSKTSPYTQVLSMIHQAHILYSKGLIKAVEEILPKATALTKQYELRELQMEIVNLQQRNERADSIEMVTEIHTLSEHVLEERKLNQLLNQSITYETIPGSRLSTEQKNSLKKLSEAALKNSSSSFTASYFRLRTCFTYCGIVNDYSTGYEWALKIIDHFKQVPHMLQLEFWRIQYVESLRNFIPSFNYFGKSELNEFVYQEAKRLDVPEVYKASILINILDSFIQAGTFQESEKKVNEVQKNIRFYTEYLSVYNEITLFFNLAYLNFGMKKYSKSLFWLNEIINSPTQVVNDSFSVITRLFRLIVFYELGHTDILENHLRAMQRYIAKQKHQYEIDLALLKCIRKIAGANDKQKLVAIMTDTRTELIKLSKNETESVAMYYFDFISWCNSKIENQSFAGIIQQKNKDRLKICSKETLPNFIK
jgi:hypothetical protein